MLRIKLKYFFVIMFVSTAFLFTTFSPTALAAGPECGKNRTFFGIPTWYKYLTFDENCEIVSNKKLDQNNDGKISTSEAKNGEKGLNNIWLITIAIVEILLTLAGILAVAYVIIGGVKFVLSQGEPQKIADARNTILYAVIGVVIAIVATQLVAFIARQMSG
jgi:Type IV secretion system pilin